MVFISAKRTNGSAVVPPLDLRSVVPARDELLRLLVSALLPPTSLLERALSEDPSTDEVVVV